jgi:hypothetical protein
MNSAQSIPRPNENNLKPAQAHALDLTRRAGGVNRFEASLLGHYSIGQRISDLIAMGYRFDKTPEIIIDAMGVTHTGVIRYAYLGWERPQAKQSSVEVSA